jgi:hypothetical protein
MRYTRPEKGSFVYKDTFIVLLDEKRSLYNSSRVEVHTTVLASLPTEVDIVDPGRDIFICQPRYVIGWRKQR